LDTSSILMAVVAGSVAMASLNPNGLAEGGCEHPLNHAEGGIEQPLNCVELH
jgi:hypothetical protein